MLLLPAPAGIPLAGVDLTPITIAGLQQEVQQLQEQQQHLGQQYTTAEAERQQLVALHREQAAQLQQQLEAAMRAAGGTAAVDGRHGQQRLQVRGDGLCWWKGRAAGHCLCTTPRPPPNASQCHERGQQSL
jgi:FtsZ-binding cell division protein ZapB